MRFIVRFFLILCLLVVGRYSYIYANMGGESNVCTVRPIHKITQTDPKLKAVEIDEEEDEEPTSFKKKYLEPGYQFTSFFDAHSPERSNYHIATKVLSPDKQYFCSSEPKYILYRVFRI